MILNGYKTMYQTTIRGEVGTIVSTSGSNRSTLGATEHTLVTPIVALKESNYSYINVGSNNTPEDGTSYALKAKISTGLSYTKSTVAITKNTDGTVTAQRIINITNSGSAAVTIGEIGIEQYFYYTSNKTDHFLIDRTPLETPLTIQPGEIGRITYTITMQ